MLNGGKHKREEDGSMIGITKYNIPPLETCDQAIVDRREVHTGVTNQESGLFTYKTEVWGNAYEKDTCTRQMEIAS